MRPRGPPTLLWGAGSELIPSRVVLNPIPSRVVLNPRSCLEKGPTFFFSELRMQEVVSMGLGSAPFLDIKPSDAALSDQAAEYNTNGTGKVVPALPHSGLPAGSQVPECRAALSRAAAAGGEPGQASRGPCLVLASRLPF